jgi:hypothetical protein
MRHIASISLGVAVLLAAPALHAQGVPTVALSKPLAERADPLTDASAVRELADGRVIVLDRGVALVLLLDSTLSKATPIGRIGSGPGEYRSPIDLLALPGDRTAIRDWASDDFLIVTPDGKPGGTLPNRGGSGCAISVRAQARIFRATDRDGRFYTEAEPRDYSGGGIGRVVDRAAIERWDGSCHADTLAFVPPRGGVSYPAGDVLPFPNPILWAVAPDGRVAIVHPDPYRIDIVDSAGVLHAGSPIRYDRVRVDEAIKRAWREEQAKPMAAITMSRTGAVGTRMSKRRVTEPGRWPAYLPPFLASAARFANDGALWVQRTTRADAPPTYDLIDEGGRVERQVTLPKRSKLVGFGDGTVYVVRLDEDDLEYLQRYRLP